MVNLVIFLNITNTILHFCSVHVKIQLHIWELSKPFGTDSPYEISNYGGKLKMVPQTS